MRRIAAHLLVITFFIVSLTPVGTLVHDDMEELRSAIIQIRSLQLSPENEAADFSIVFSNTVISLQSAAGLFTTVSTQTKNQQTDVPQMTVTSRLPFIVHKTRHPVPDESSQILEQIAYLNFYRSFIPPPDTPPPLS